MVSTSIRRLSRENPAGAIEKILTAIASAGTYAAAAEVLGCSRASLDWAISDLQIRPQAREAAGLPPYAPPVLSSSVQAPASPPKATRAPPRISTSAFWTAVRAKPDEAAATILAAVQEHRTYARAAAALGCSRGSLDWAITRLGLRAQIRTLVPRGPDPDRVAYIRALRQEGLSWNRIDVLTAQAYGCNRSNAQAWRLRYFLPGSTDLRPPKE